MLSCSPGLQNRLPPRERCGEQRGEQRLSAHSHPPPRRLQLRPPAQPADGGGLSQQPKRRWELWDSLAAGSLKFSEASARRRHRVLRPLNLFFGLLYLPGILAQFTSKFTYFFVDRLSVSKH